MTRKRTILVRLQSVWDRRVVLNGARRLADDNDFRGRIYINADEPIEIRRQNILKRLKSKADREGKSVNVSQDGVLIVNSVPAFSVQRGFIRCDVSAGDADSTNHV